MKALAESKDITIYLNPLQKHFTQLEETDFAEAKPLLHPLIHVVCLVWANSRYYCHSSKLIILLRQICNLFIHQVIYQWNVYAISNKGPKRELKLGP